MVDRHAAAMQLDGDPPVTIAAAMFEDDLLDGAAHFHLFLARVAGLEKTIESGAADLGQPAHRLDTKAALRGHQFADRFPDAVTPEPVLPGRRASTFAHAAFKKSTSRVLFSSAFFSCAFSWRRRCSAP